MSVTSTFLSDVKVLMAPLAGLSSLPFRMLNRGFGCGYSFLEMVNARSLHYSSKKTKEIMRTQPDDRPLGVQILGKDPYFILKGIEKLRNYKFDVLDFNAACPQKKITDRGEGAYLLKDPVKLQEILKLIVKESWVPVTLKMRLGWDNVLTACEIASYAQEAGINAVIVHGRTRCQGYGCAVNYNAIRKIKETISIPVIGSGDILDARSAKKMFDETGCAAVAVARGTLGNPWIFHSIKEFLKTGKEVAPPDADEITRVMKIHLNLFVDFYGEKTGVIRFRKFYIWYTRGFNNVKHLRPKIMTTTTQNEMLTFIEELRTRHRFSSMISGVLK